MLGFYDQLRYSYPPYKLTTPVDHSLAPTILVEKIRSAYPKHQLIQLSLSTAPDRAAVAKLEGNHNDNQLVFVNPGTGVIFAYQRLDYQDGLSFIHSLHHGKPFGLVGRIIASISGISLLILWLVGLILWWRHSSRIYAWQGKSWRIKLRSVHRWLGLILGGILALLAILGALLNFDKPLKQWLNPPPHIKIREIDTQQSFDLERAIAQGSVAYPGVHLDRIYFPTPDNYLLQLHFKDGAYVYLHGVDGRVIKIDSISSHWTNWLYSFHTWRFLETGRSWVIAVLGATLLLLVGSGFLTYWRKRFH